MKNKKMWIITAILLFGGMGVFYVNFLPQSKTTRLEPAGQREEIPLKEAADTAFETEGETAAEAECREPAMVYVHVCGQVKEPGVYSLEAESRVEEAVEAAGGFTKAAAQASVNLARRIEDGEQLYIASKEEVASPLAAPTDEKDRLININSASREELMELPGIGAAKAEAILSYRAENGSFKTIEDIQKIEGIKKGVFEKIKDKITT